MTPARIIQQAAVEGVRLAVTPAGTIKATGNQGTVNRWLPLIREHKPEIIEALQEAVNDDTLSDPAMEARRRRVLAMLAANPGLRLAVVCDGEGDPVSVAVAIRDKGTCEVLIPAARFDPFALIELVGRHGGTLH